MELFPSLFDDYLEVVVSGQLPLHHVNAYKQSQGYSIDPEQSQDVCQDHLSLDLYSTCITKVVPSFVYLSRVSRCISQVGTGGHCGMKGFETQHCMWFNLQFSVYFL